jgi:hypothetical protein
MMTAKALKLAAVQFTPRFGEKEKNLSRIHERAEIYPSKTRDKSFNAINNVLTDRQPQH